MENQNQISDLPGLDDYYQKEFTKIQESDENYKGKWNWWAFFFSGFWCLFKGCWFIAILYFFTNSIVKFRYEITHYLAFQLAASNLIWSVIMGLRGTWFYYNVKIKKKQLPFL